MALRDSNVRNPEFAYVEVGNSWEANKHNDGGFTIRWGAKDIGFGELTFYYKKKQLFCDTETMSKEFVRKALEHLTRTLLSANFV